MHVILREKNIHASIYMNAQKSRRIPRSYIMSFAATSKMDRVYALHAHVSRSRILNQSYQAETY